MSIRRSLLRPLSLGFALSLLVPAFTQAQSEAEQVLNQALSEAEQSDRLVFLHSGAPWCGWCKRLEDWLVREDIAPIFSKDFVSVKIDVDEMQGGRKLMNRYDNGYGGVPLLVIIHPDGTVLINSFAPNGRNIGSPYTDWEIDHWNTMMRTVAKRINEEEIKYMAQTLAKDRT